MNLDPAVAPQARRQAAEQEVVTDEEEVGEEDPGVEGGKEGFYDVCKLENEKK